MFSYSSFALCFSSILVLPKPILEQCFRILLWLFVFLRVLEQDFVELEQEQHWLLFVSVVFQQL